MEKTPIEPTRYWGDALSSFSNGCVSDVRMKLAVEFIKECRVFTPDDEPAVIVRHALGIAEELLKQCEAAGLVKGLPETDELNQSMRRHIRRQARANVLGQLAVNELVQDEQRGKLQPALPGMLPPGANGGRQ